MGKSSQSTIEINGKRYDARTGKLITPIRSQKVIKPAAASRVQRASVVQDIARTTPTPSRSIHKKLQRSSTLMRHAVKKPAPAPRARAVKTPVQPASVRKPALKPAPTAKVILHQDIQRQSRAKKIPQSTMVSKFGTLATDASKPATKQAVSKQLVPGRTAQLSVPAAPSTSRPYANPAQSVIENALRNATSHQQTFSPKKQLGIGKAKKSLRKKLATYGAGLLAALLLVGFIAYQNIPNITMRYASARAGINASLPGYRPAGFSLSPRIQYTPGQITLSFKSNSDDRSFSITQRETAWNSDALLSNYLASKPGQVQRYEDKGRTIFLYGDNSATWVSGGVWYDIDGNSQLNSDQLIRIATSL